MLKFSGFVLWIQCESFQLSMSRLPTVCKRDSAIVDKVRDITCILWYERTITPTQVRNVCYMLNNLFTQAENTAACVSHPHSNLSHNYPAGQLLIRLSDDILRLFNVENYATNRKDISDFLLGSHCNVQTFWLHTRKRHSTPSHATTSTNLCTSFTSLKSPDTGLFPPTV